MKRTVYKLTTRDNNMRTRISGGQRGFRRAVQDALNGRGRRMCSPSVHWAAEQGFFATPSRRVSGMNDGEIEIWVAGFDANDGSPYCLPEYSDVREACLATQRVTNDRVK